MFMLCRHNKGKMFGIGRASNVIMAYTIEHISDYAFGGQRFKETGELKTKKCIYISSFFHTLKFLN